MAKFWSPKPEIGVRFPSFLRQNIGCINLIYFQKVLILTDG